MILANSTFTHAYDNSTTITVLGLFMLLVLAAGMITLPRRLTVIPLVLVACFIPVAQRLAVFSLDLTILRCIIAAGWVRVFTRHEHRGLRWKALDIAMLAWAFFSSVIYIIQQGTFDAVVYKCGVAVDTVAMYLLIRVLIRTWDDVFRLVDAISLLMLPIVFCFFLEFKSGHNLFAVFGGVPAITLVREGRLRCQGAFSHSILAGCFFASLVPIFFAGIVQAGARRKGLAVFALLGCFAIIAMCGSATPLMGVSAACAGTTLFWVRKRIRLIRWSCLLVLVGLHLSMKSPVWSLIQRVDVIGGSTGWHRYHLINAAIGHLGEWWLVGTVSTAHWGYFMFDVANQYILEGVRGGMITLLCFVVVIGIAFRGVGAMCRQVAGDRRRLWLAWAMGVSLFAHCTAFIGVSYFGQMIVIWYLLLAMIGSLTPTCNERLSAVSVARRSRARGDADGGGDRVASPARLSPVAVLTSPVPA